MTPQLTTSAFVPIISALNNQSSCILQISRFWCFLKKLGAMDRFPLTALECLDSILNEADNAVSAQHKIVFQPCDDLVTAGIWEAEAGQDLFTRLSEWKKKVVSDVKLQKTMDDPRVMKTSPFDELLSKPIVDIMDKYNKHPELRHTKIVARRLATESVAVSPQGQETMESTVTPGHKKSFTFGDLLRKPIVDNMDKYNKHPELRHTNIVARRLASQLEAVAAPPQSQETMEATFTPGPAHSFSFDELLSKPIVDNMDKYNKYPELRYTNILARRLAVERQTVPLSDAAGIPKWSTYSSVKRRVPKIIRRGATTMGCISESRYSLAYKKICASLEETK